MICTNVQFCRIKGCGGEGCPLPPIIFERPKLPQQIIYHRKGNLSKSPNHFKYRENILILRFYEQFSRNDRHKPGSSLRFDTKIWFVLTISTQQCSRPTIPRLDSATYFRPGSCGGKISFKFSDKKSELFHLNCS